MKPLSVIFYRGPSMIDGKPIIAIATTRTRNHKTGQVVQTWIMRDDQAPHDAKRAGQDASVCGTCPIKAQCYVVVHQAPLSVWKTKESLPFIHEGHAKYLQGRVLREGSYGDPAAVPRFHWDFLHSLCGSARLGYTHQWRSFPALAGKLQASVESPALAHEAQALGYKTFRIMPVHDAALMPGEILCPSEKTDGRVKCVDCRLCDGKKRNVAITAHGANRLAFA